MGYPSNVRSRSAGIRVLLPSYRRRCLSSKLAVRPSWPSTAAIGMFAPSFAFPRDMGCYARLFPFAQVVVLVPIIIIPLFFAVPAILFFGLWSPFSPDTALHRCSRPPSVSQPYPLVSEADWCPRQRKLLAIGVEPQRQGPQPLRQHSISNHHSKTSRISLRRASLIDCSTALKIACHTNASSG